MNMKQINERGLEALSRELGAAATVRFIRQFENGYGDYTPRSEKLCCAMFQSTISQQALPIANGGRNEQRKALLCCLFGLFNPLTI